jgi:epoxyqueuosine reductase
LFAKSAVKRIGRARFVRNVLVAIGNSGDANLAAEAERLIDDKSPLVRGAAIWALGRLDRTRLETCAKTRRESESDPELSAEWAAALSSACSAPSETRVH